MQHTANDNSLSRLLHDDSTYISVLHRRKCWPLHTAVCERRTVHEHGAKGIVSDYYWLLMSLAKIVLITWNLHTRLMRKDPTKR